MNKLTTFAVPAIKKTLNAKQKNAVKDLRLRNAQSAVKKTLSQMARMGVAGLSMKMGVQVKFALRFK